MRSFVQLCVLTTSCACGFIPSISITSKNHVFCESVSLISKSPENLLVHSIRFEIQDQDSISSQNESDITSKNLKTHENEPFLQAVFDQDLKMLAKEFDKVDPTIHVAQDEVDVIIKVWKKPVIHSILVEGNRAVDTKRLLKEASLQENTVLDRNAFFKGIQKIRAYYVKKGYFEVDIQSNIEQLRSGVIDVTLHVTEGRAGFIEKISFYNFSKKEQDDLRDSMATKEYSLWHSWLTSQGTYYADVFRQDEMQILSYLQNKGLLDAKVATSIHDSPKNKNRITIDIRADRGREYYLGDVRFEGSLQDVTEHDLLKRIGLKPGSLYSPEAIRIATRVLYDTYGSKGYIDTIVIPQMKLVSETHNTLLKPTYDVTFTIEQGKKYRVGLIRIIGNTKTEASVVIHETLLVPGDLFDSTLLAKTEERLRNIGYFKSVNVYAVRSDQKDIDIVPFRDIHIEVEENPTTANFSAFAGYNTTESVSGGFNISESNFKMSGISDAWSKGLRALRGGGEYIGLNATIGLKQKSYSLSWTKPYFLDSKWALGIDLQKIDNEFASTDYAIKSKQLLISLKRPLNAFVTFGTQYRLHDAHIHLESIKNKRRNKELIRESKNGGVISALGVSLGYDSTNHPITPTQGLRSNLAIEYAGLFGDHHFATTDYLNTWFYPLTKQGVLKLKGNIQLIKTLFGTRARQLPMDERLYSGGESSVRGYQFNILGPRFGDVNRTPRGGLTSLLLSSEYEHNLTKRLHGFVFVDGGNVWWKTLEFGKLQYSTGFGIKFFIAENAPLTVGVGYPINPKRSQDVQRFFFSIGAAF